MSPGDPANPPDHPFLSLPLPGTLVRIMYFTGRLVHIIYFTVIENTTRVPVGDDLSYNEWFLKRI